ncbi:long-chain-fatty-acid--CoA ligase 5-like isoform X2 [Stegodyphus dumicola]|uniref:long-chain-fatty-acid--CoA ligase 5-like isoform X2 n=1 Tax=Stegodyphus dumicola TaxID=202533 RepID=UPI0015A8D902|nr:long-chain-fatty-acid--CoA ligase 5-like isoform X2 [Stegodyphus dumicola]
MSCVKEQPLITNVDLQNQSVEIPDSGGIRQSKLVPLGKTIDFLYDDVKTLLHAMQKGCKLSGDGPCLGYRNGNSEYMWISYSDVIRRAKTFASGLCHLGMRPGQSTYIGIYCYSRVEWVLTEYACYNQSAVTVPLYDTLGPNVCSFVINQAQIQMVVCDNEEKARILLEKAETTPSLTHIISVNEVSLDIKDLANRKNINLLSFHEVEELGSKNNYPMVPPDPSDLATVCYTSGTTGDPKGVMLTHANFVLTSSAIMKHMGDKAPAETDVMISYLPLAHVFERISQVTAFMAGGRIGFYRGDIKLLSEDIKTLKPTYMPAVPRVLNRIYDKVNAQVKRSKFKKFMFDFALRRKQVEIDRLILGTNSIWDKFVFKSIREATGGRLRLLMSSAAPIDGKILKFFTCVLGCVVFEGYGQTEACGPICLNILGDFSGTNVGPPVPCCQIKLVDVPQMGYYSSKSQGENGALKIVDRKKNIFKLAQGEYVAPEKIESIYLRSPYVAQIYLHGDSLQNYVVAIVVPEKEEVLSWCESKSMYGIWSALCKNKEVKKMILEDMRQYGEMSGLKSFEQVKDIYLHPDAFTPESGLITPTLKNKRSEWRNYFKDAIESMYNVNNFSSSSN